MSDPSAASTVTPIDLVKRLRAHGAIGRERGDYLREEAADRIEQLERERDEAQQYRPQTEYPGTRGKSVGVIG